MAFALGHQTGTAQPRSASSHELRVRIDCPQLSRDASAALEARARTELALVQPTGGVAGVRCTEGRATLTWRSLGASRGRTSVVELTSDTSELVEQLLEGLYELLSADARGRSSGDGASVEPPGATGAPSSMRDATAGPAQTTPPDDESTFSEWPDAPQPDRDKLSEAPGRRRRVNAGRVVTSGAVATETWFEPFLVLAELRAGVELWPVERFAFVLLLRGRLAANPPDQVSLLGVGSALGIAYQFEGQPWKLHATAGFDRWFVRVEDAEADRNRHADLLTMSLGAALELLDDSPALYLTPTLRFYPNPLLVRRDGESITRSPRLAPVLYLSAEF